MLSLAAAAGGLGWGIRGQYGHETGAMIAGVLVGLGYKLAKAWSKMVIRAWMEATVSSPMFEIRKVDPLIFP